MMSLWAFPLSLPPLASAINWIDGTMHASELYPSCHDLVLLCAYRLQ